MHSVHVNAFGVSILLAKEAQFRKFPWGVLAERETESWVYLACWVQRSQSEVIRKIYSPKIPTNIRPVIRARRILEKLGYLDQRPSREDHRKMELVSKPQGFIPYAEMRIETRKSLRGKQNLSEIERKALLRILDSNWFRQSLDKDLDYKTTGDGAVQAIAEFVEQICVLADGLGIVLPHMLPQPENVVDHASFDDFMKKWSSQKIEPYPRIEEILAYVRSHLLDNLPYSLRLKLLVSNTLEGPLYPALCMPQRLARKLSTIGRVPVTLVHNLYGTLREARAEGIID
jgi:hypothetical protein